MAKTELSSIGLPVKDRRLMLETAEVLKKNISFYWIEPQEWAGLTKEDLTELVVHIAAFIGITPQKADKIAAFFADQYRLPHREVPDGALCQPYSVDGRFINIIIVLNRSFEVSLADMLDTRSHEEKEQSHLKGNGLFDSSSGNDNFVCNLTPQESIIWKITEELKHAHVFLTAGSSLAYSSWTNRYLEILKKKNSRLGNVYDLDINEVAANRVVLRVLSCLADSESRRAYFRECYLESLRSRRIFFLSCTDAAFIYTNYKVPTTVRIKRKVIGLLEKFTP